MHARIPSAASVDDECRMMGRCRCGGDWLLTYNEVALRRGVWVDFIAVRCAYCGLEAAFEYDVSCFFEPRPGIWGRGLTAEDPRGCGSQRCRCVQLRAMSVSAA
jgi:hypothetical protein